MLHLRKAAIRLTPPRQRIHVRELREVAGPVAGASAAGLLRPHHMRDLHTCTYFFFFSFVVCESTERPFIQISGLSTVVEMRCGNTERSARPRTRSTTNSHIEQQPICTLLPILPNLHGSLQLAPNRAQRPAVVRLRNSSNIPPAHRGAAAVQHDRRAATVSTRKGRKDGSGNNDHQRRLSDPPLPRPQAR